MHANGDRWRAVKDSERRGGGGEEQKDSLAVLEVLLQERALLPGAGMGAAPGMSSPCEGALGSHCGGKWKELCLEPTPRSAHIIALLASGPALSPSLLSSLSSISTGQQRVI